MHSILEAKFRDHSYLMFDKKSCSETVCKFHKKMLAIGSFFLCRINPAAFLKRLQLWYFFGLLRSFFLQLFLETPVNGSFLLQNFCRWVLHILLKLVKEIKKKNFKKWNYRSTDGFSHCSFFSVNVFKKLFFEMLDFSRSKRNKRL